MLLQKDFVHDTLQRYTGPSDPVDLILMCHVAYYFADTLEDQIRRGLSWLGDNGKMLIVHDQNSIHKLVGKICSDTGIVRDRNGYYLLFY